MDIEIVAIGDEVLYGYAVNSNASYISQQLVAHGFIPTRHAVVGDDKERVKSLLMQALQRKSLVITTGGLGPTLDDWTRKIAADLFGVPLEANGVLKTRLEALYGKGHPTLQDQMMQPQGAYLFENTLGSASGFILQDQKRFGDGLLIALPGVPQEMRQMFTTKVIPYLLENYPPNGPLFVKVLHFVDLVEHQIDPELRKMQRRFPLVHSGIYPGFSTVTVHLMAGQKEALDPAVGYLRERFAKNLYESPTGTLSEALHLELVKKKITIATAESCTGGALGASFVQHPGASSYYLGTIVAYANSVKIQQLDVMPETLKSHGAASVEVTQEMARSVRQKLGADLGIAVSGILGPTGATATQPVGTICASISYKEFSNYCWTEQLRGNRQMLLERSVQKLLAKTLFFIRENA